MAKSARNEDTPMLKQYFSIKAQHPEAIVKKEITTYTLTASEVNTSYRFIINAKGTMRIYLVRLVYE